MAEQGTHKGLYGKYIVTKASGKPLAPGAEFIVLRIDDGRYVDACRAGAEAFADAVSKDNPRLARDIWIRLAELKQAQK